MFEFFNVPAMLEAFPVFFVYVCFETHDGHVLDFLCAFNVPVMLEAILAQTLVASRHTTSIMMDSGDCVSLIREALWLASYLRGSPSEHLSCSLLLSMTLRVLVERSASKCLQQLRRNSTFTGTHNSSLQRRCSLRDARRASSWTLAQSCTHEHPVLLTEASKASMSALRSSCFWPSMCPTCPWRSILVAYFGTHDGFSMDFGDCVSHSSLFELRVALRNIPSCSRGFMNPQGYELIRSSCSRCFLCPPCTLRSRLVCLCLLRDAPRAS